MSSELAVSVEKKKLITFTHEPISREKKLLAVLVMCICAAQAIQINMMFAQKQRTEAILLELRMAVGQQKGAMQQERRRELDVVESAIDSI